MESSSQRVFEGTLLLGDALQTLKQTNKEKLSCEKFGNSYVLFISLGDSHQHSGVSENSCSTKTRLTWPIWHFSNLFVYTPVFLFVCLWFVCVCMCVCSSPSWEKNKNKKLLHLSIHPHTYPYTCNMEKRLETQFQEPVRAEVTARIPQSDNPRFEPNSTSSVA